MSSGYHSPVVVGVDGSADSYPAIRYAAWEADRRQLPLRVVHGLLYPPAYGFTAMPESYLRLLMTDARALVQHVAATIAEDYPDLSVTPSVIVGGDANVLLNESKDASLVVVGSRGQGGFAHLLLGSVSSQLAAHAQAPVIVVPSATGEMSANMAGPVVVGIGQGDTQAAAVAFAAEEAAGRRVPLIAVYVWQNPLGHNLGPTTVRHFDAIPQAGSPTSRCGPPCSPVHRCGSCRRTPCPATSSWESTDDRRPSCPNRPTHPPADTGRRGPALRPKERTRRAGRP